MIKKNIFIPLDREIRLNYNSVAEVARKINVSRQRMINILNNLENEKGITLKTLTQVCEALGYEIILKKKKKAN